MVMTPRYDPIIAEASRRFGVPQETIRAMMRVESGGRPNAVSSAGAGGLMQIMPGTYTELAARHGFGPDRFDPRNNIMAGAAYARQMYDQFGSWDDAFGAYNAGPGRWAQVKAGTRAAPRETQAYIPAVKASARIGPGQPMGGTDVAFSPITGAGLLNADDEKNYMEGLGNLLNMGQEPSQPPRTDPAALPGTTQTDRLDLSGRLNTLLEQYLQQPQKAMPSQLQYMLGGAGNAVGKLAGVRDRKVGIGEILGALGGGVTSGGLAYDEARQQRQGTELDRFLKVGAYQNQSRTAALNEANAIIDNRYKQAMTDKAMRPEAPETYTLAPGAQRRDAAGNIIAENPTSPRTPATPPSTVDLGDGPQGPGVYARNPDGTLGPRLGASINAPGTETTTSLTPEQAQRNGLPPPPANSPYANPNLSPKGRSNLVAAQAKSWEKRAAENAEQVKSANTMITDMQRFQYLNSQTDTGGVTGSPIGSAVRSLYDNNVKEMNAITARITPTLRQPGSGATSDFDARMFQEGTVGVGKPREVNDNIATATIEGGKNLIAKTQFEEAYFNAYQHTQGMEQAWQKYLNDNPIFDPKAPTGSFRLNANRIDWQTYFQNGMKAPEPGRPQAPMSGGEGGGAIPPPPPPPGSVIVP